ncbi:hypothetical protein R1sor_004826 [Riccia sorocarpa]|uniref:Uncharacterized protein n=1 Tax=Riccia sorocarpa TaxID=122646 RepID=A0ABD3HM63_9MARC
MLLPNLKTNSWDKHSLDFVGAHERIAEDNVPTDGGLLCYRIRKIRGSELWITLRESGSYKVVVAFGDQHLLRKAFIYDSVSKSWSNSAALTPVLDSHVDQNEWEVRSVVCSIGELLWVIEKWDPLSDNLIKRLFKYNFKLDAWSMVTQESAFLEGQVRLVYNDVENRPVMVSFDPPDDVNFSGSERFPCEFLDLVPNLGKFGVEDIELLMNGAGDKERSALEPGEIAFGGGTWYIVAELTSYKQGVDVFALSLNPPRVTRLPKIHDRVILTYGTFAATLKAFV